MGSASASSLPTSAGAGENLVLILDFGSQYTQLITRRVRQLGVLSLCVSGTAPLSSITGFHPRAVILSGGPHSVHASGAPSFPAGFLDFAADAGAHVLGVGYGMQLLVQSLGGAVEAGERQEYGDMEVETTAPSSTLYGESVVGIRQSVWMSHGDEVVRLPQGFEVVARSVQGAITAIEHREKRFYGLQYHPEVAIIYCDTSTQGKETLRHFLFDVCGIKADWKIQDVLDEEIKTIKSMVGTDEHVICALSGGVDSTIAATLVHNVIGDRLHCVFVDNAKLTYDLICIYKEKERVMSTFNSDLHLPVTCIDASEQFLSKLKGVKDPEMKRKIVGKEFIAQTGKRPEYLVQGTLYPDVIESCLPPGSGMTHSHTIKSHHNVDGLPEDMKLKLIEPLKLLFKDESFLKRHPFPGPGLAVRIPSGDVTEGNALEILRQADEIYVQAIRDAGLYDTIWQAFAVLLPVETVGVQGDQRTYGYPVTLRAITSEDGMTADWYYFERKFLADVSNRICNNVRGVNHVCVDITSKPPATVEWE
ncbi:hypothetical protein CFC21_002651 [Triticum aestivum]|uniref:GMP synthase [glutamine-hydrolyzing] n=1 Tax=Triticum aestivum TaxID=4565 RepID=A0A3B5Y1I2_WHEAT|nr:hypothetical protein CFC21_002651 [Triticum aestivum]